MDIRINIKYMAVIWLLAACLTVDAQEEVLEDQVEKWTEAAEGMDYPEDFPEEIMEIMARPVDLNSSRLDDLLAIPFLTSLQQTNLISYRMEYGKILSVYELTAISGFDSLIVSRILPFIKTGRGQELPSFTPRNLIRHAHHELIIRVSRMFPAAEAYRTQVLPDGMPDAPVYPGNPFRYWFRYQYRYLDKIMIGVAGEKDPGEQFFAGNQQHGMDHYAATLSISNIGVLKNLTIGNFRVNFGQGLTTGSGNYYGSTPGFCMNTIRPTGIKPTLSNNEINGLKGMGGTISAGRVEGSVWFSYCARDATVIQDYADGPKQISALSGNGYHRTETEIQKRNTLRESYAGANLTATVINGFNGGLKIGATATWLYFSIPFVAGDEPSKMYAFSGNTTVFTGFDFNGRYKTMFFSGEICRSINGALGFIASLSLTPSAGNGITIICRHYAPAFWNPYGHAFSQSSANTNESGVFISAGAIIKPRLSMSLFADLFRFPWLRFRTDSPTIGQEYGLCARWIASGDLETEARLSIRNGEINETMPTGEHLHRVVAKTSETIRLSVIWMPWPEIRFKTRLDIRRACLVPVSKPYGYMIYQEVQTKPANWIRGFTFRIGLFDVPDYESRIYTYEPDVLNSFSVPAFEGRGMRSCLLLALNPLKFMKLWIKGGLTYYMDRDQVGSGHDATPGNLRCDVSAQLAFEF